MLITFLDGAANMGFAYGPSGQCPTSGSVEVWDKREPIEIGVGRATRWLVRHIREFAPEMVGIEHPQSPGGLQSRIDKTGQIIPGRGNARSTESQIGIFYALHGILGVYGIRAASPYPQTIRTAVCGRPYAPKVFDPIKKQMVKGDTKVMVRDYLVLLGFVPKGCTDFDRCDGVCGHAYMSAVYGRAALPLVLRA